MTKTSLETPAATPQVGPRKTPSGIFSRCDGYYLVGEKDGSEAFICAPVDVLDAVRTPRGSGLLYRFQFSDLDSIPRIVPVPAGGLVGDHRSVAMQLADAGLPMGDAPPSALARLLLHKVRQLPADRRGTLVDRPGFHELPGGGLGFAAPDGRTITADATAEGAILALSHPTGPQLGGTLEGMREAIAAMAHSGLDHLAAGFLAGVAGVVVDFAELEFSPILTLVGSSTTGKSMSAHVAASMTGPPSGPDSRFTSLATTLNAIEGYLTAASGSFFAGDETASFPRERLQELIFLLSSSQGKRRMKADASLHQVRRWLTYVILTSEVPLSELMRGPNGEEPRAGTAVRAASVDTSDARCLDARELEAVKGFETHHGHALEPVVRALLHSTISDPNARAALRAEITQRSVALAGPGADSRAIRSAAVFAVLAVSGRLLREVSITPVDFDADALIARLWTAFQVSSDAPHDPVETAIQRLTEALYNGRGNRIVRTTEAEHRRFNDPIGYYDDQDGCLRYYVIARDIAKLAGGKVSSSTLVKALRNRGLLKTPDQHGRVKSRRIPGVGDVPHYRIELPLPDAALEPTSALASALNPVSGTRNAVQAGARRLLM